MNLLLVFEFIFITFSNIFYSLSHVIFDKKKNLIISRLVLNIYYSNGMKYAYL